MNETPAATGTRARILSTALRLFIDNGFEATSVRDIAEQSGIAKSALYHHFRTKDDIVVSLVNQRLGEIEELAEWIRGQPAGPDLALRAALRWIDGSTPERLQAMRLGHANPPLMRRLAARGPSVRSVFDTIIDLLVPADAPPAQRLYVRMMFDSIAAALVSAQGITAGDADILAAARRATEALGNALGQD